VLGSWGFFAYNNEWGAYPESEPIFFTVRDAEPCLSIRITAQGELVAKTLIS
jgi:hypothetical protein